MWDLLGPRLPGPLLAMPMGPVDTGGLLLRGSSWIEGNGHEAAAELKEGNQCGGSKVLK